MATYSLASGEPSVSINDIIAIFVEAASQPSNATISMKSVLSTVPLVSKQAEISLVSKLLNLYCLVNWEHLYPVFSTISHFLSNSKAFLWLQKAQQEAQFKYSLLKVCILIELYSVWLLLLGKGPWMLCLIWFIALVITSSFCEL